MWSSPLEALQSALGALEPLGDHLVAVNPFLLALGMALQLVKVGTLGEMWLRIVRSASPGAPVRRADALVPYLIGTGANSVLPAKGGLALRVILAHRRMRATSPETLAGTMATESLLGLLPTALLVGIACATGVAGHLTGAIAVGAPSVMAAAVAGVVVVTLGLAALRLPRLRRRLAGAPARLRRGAAILRDRRSLGAALALQLSASGLRLAGIACFLAAFGIAPTATLVLLVVVAELVAGLVPVTPGGVGAQQGLIVVALAGAASSATALAFGVGMQAAVIATDLMAGGAALALGGGVAALAGLVGPGRRAAGAYASAA